MERYTPRHAAESRLRRFIRWTDEPMNGVQQTLCGAFMGLVTAFLLIHCYFG